MERLRLPNSAVSFARLQRWGPVNESNGRSCETAKLNGNVKRARFTAYFHGGYSPGYRASTVKVKKRVVAGSNSARTSSNHINFQRAR